METTTITTPKKKKTKKKYDKEHKNQNIIAGVRKMTKK